MKFIESLAQTHDPSASTVKMVVTHPIGYMDHLLMELKSRLNRREFRICRLSKIHELSQRAIARRVRISQQAVCKTLAKIRRIAQAIKATLHIAAAL